MRIAFFCDSFKPYLSGVTNSIDILVKELRELGHRVYIFAPRYPGHVDTDPDIIRFISLPTAYPNFRLALPYLSRIPEIDLIHAHSPFQTGLLARYLAHKRRIPFVYTFHTLFTKYVHYARFIPEPLSKLAIVRYLQAFCRRTDLIIAPSQMAKRVLKAWKVPGRIEVVPTGVDFSHLKFHDEKTREKLKTSLRQKYNIPLGEKVLIYVGRLSKEKNIPFLLNAFKRISSGPAPTPHFVLVGGGPLEEEIRKKNIKNLFLLGEKRYPDILSYYLIGDLFVFASLTETQGMVLAEAKASGLPVLALFAGGLADTVRSGIDGYLTSRNIPDFLKHLKRLLNEEDLLAKMGQAARDDAHERLSSTVTAKAIEKTYNEVCFLPGH